MDLVLYRKYRPKTLDEVIGQQPIIETFKAALAKKNVGHALLFTGPKGVGKTSLARILAHQINQVDYDLSQTPLDIIEIDAASNGRIDEVRDLREKIKFLPLELTYKVYIIDEVHMLTKEAFNALLKTLEEPPQHIIFILATTEIHKVPATIISRCQRFAFQIISQKVLIDYLNKIAKLEKIQIKKPALDLIAEHAQGSLRDALSLLEQISSLNQMIDTQLVEEILGLPPQTAIDDLIDSLLNQDLQKNILTYQNLLAQGVDATVLARQLTQALRQKLRQKPQPKNALKIISILEDLLDVFSSSQAQAVLEIILLKHAQPTTKTKTHG